jgi:hypothetical protein
VRSPPDRRERVSSWSRAMRAPAASAGCAAAGFSRSGAAPRGLHQRSRATSKVKAPNCTTVAGLSGGTGQTRMQQELVGLNGW